MALEEGVGRLKTPSFPTGAPGKRGCAGSTDTLLTPFFGSKRGWGSSDLLLSADGLVGDPDRNGWLPLTGELNASAIGIRFAGLRVGSSRGTRLKTGEGKGFAPPNIVFELLAPGPK